MKTIHHVVDIPAPIHAVWEALSTQPGLSGWWSNQVESSVIEPGATVSFRFQPGFNPVMHVIDLEMPHRLSWKCVAGHEPWKDNDFIFVLDQRHQDVRLRFWQHYAIELKDDAFGIYNYNWGYYLQSLYDLMTTGRGKPFEG